VRHAGDGLTPDGVLEVRLRADGHGTVVLTSATRSDSVASMMIGSGGGSGFGGWWMSH
jgi:hypothetical protein